MKIALLFSVLSLLPLQAAVAQYPAAKPALTLPLWPGVPPAAGTGTAVPEADTTRATDPLVGGRTVIRLGNVSKPTLTLYKPEGTPSGAAVLVFPGGGYQILAMDLEGTEVCDWLTHTGVACVLVKYRVPDSGPYPRSSAALDDAQRAMGMVRHNARAWGIDPRRIGVLGFSAGAHLAAALSTHYDGRLYPAVDAADAEPVRPDFALILYPGYLAVAEHDMAPNPEIHVTSATPPTFLLQAENDPVHVENVLVYFAALKAAGVPAELHVYAEGGHGYGLRSTALPVTRWPELAESWFRTIGILSRETPSAAEHPQ